MLIDWVTMRLPAIHIDRDQWSRLRMLGDRVARYHAQTGELRWESQAWDSVRSDSHQISVRLGSDAFWVQGSPARVVGSGCAVFGEGVSSSLDLFGCVDVMRQYVSKNLGEIFPTSKKWIVSRVDVTQNLLLPSLEEVRTALRILRDCEGGRYRVSQQQGDTVYWSHGSKLRKGKAYAKGPQLEKQISKKEYSGRFYSLKELESANRLLRLELTLGSQWWRERSDKQWFDITPDDLKGEWASYFERMIGSAEMKTNDDVYSRLVSVCETEARARAAYSCWLMIQQLGWETASVSFPKTSWYRHLKSLRSAGLGDADISAGTVVSFRRKIIEASAVHSWGDILAA